MERLESMQVVVLPGYEPPARPLHLSPKLQRFVELVLRRLGPRSGPRARR